jgi:hypothetical protein
MKRAANPPSDDVLVKRVRSALADAPGVEEKKMFGSIAFMVGGKMCVTARAERIMCRIEPDFHEAAVARQGSQTVLMKGRPCRGYVYVSRDAVKTDRALKYWIGLALEYNQSQRKKS